MEGFQEFILVNGQYPNDGVAHEMRGRIPSRGFNVIRRANHVGSLS